MDNERVARTLSEDFGLDSSGDSYMLSRPFSYTEIFDELCPMYMSMGMSYDEYWNDNPWKAFWIRKSEKKKIERNNFYSWLNGLYTYKALLDVSPLINIFDKQRRPEEYLLEPIDLFGDKEQVEQRKNEKAMQAGIENMMQWAMAVNAKKAGDNDGGNTKP